MTTASKTPDPSPDVPQPAKPTPPGPGPKPAGPTHPPSRFVDAFDLALSLGPDTAVDLARPHKPSPPSKPPRKPINTKPIRASETTRPTSGEEPAPGSAVATFPAARESNAVRQHRCAGADVPAVRARGDGRAVGAGGAATFTVPDTRRPLRFDEGEHRLVGRIAIGTGPQYDSLRWSR